MFLRCICFKTKLKPTKCLILTIGESTKNSIKRFYVDSPVPVFDRKITVFNNEGIFLNEKILKNSNLSRFFITRGRCFHIDEVQIDQRWKFDSALRADHEGKRRESVSHHVHHHFRKPSSESKSETEFASDWCNQTYKTCHIDDEGQLPLINFWTAVK